MIVADLLTLMACKPVGVILCLVVEDLRLVYIYIYIFCLFRKHFGM